MVARQIPVESWRYLKVGCSVSCSRLPSSSLVSNSNLESLSGQISPAFFFCVCTHMPLSRCATLAHLRPGLECGCVVFANPTRYLYPNEPNTTALPDELSSCTNDFSSMRRRCEVRMRSSAWYISSAAGNKVTMVYIPSYSIS